jgi:hypothetical protein
VNQPRYPFKVTKLSDAPVERCALRLPGCLGDNAPITIRYQFSKSQSVQSACSKCYREAMSELTELAGKPLPVSASRNQRRTNPTRAVK